MNNGKPYFLRLIVNPNKCVNHPLDFIHDSIFDEGDNKAPTLVEDGGIIYIRRRDSF
jgi:hypothetical protein